MRTKTLLFISGMLAGIFPALATTHTVISTGDFTFAPSNLTIQVNDTVIFTLGSEHNAVEVSKDTWDANAATSNGGFSMGFGGGETVFSSTGTFYYVCAPHASFGMKGVITVSGTTGIPVNQSNSGIQELEALYPNPFYDRLTIGFTLAEPSDISIDLLDIRGTRIQQLVNEHYVAGRHAEDFDLSSLKPGYYFVVYNSPRRKNVSSLIKAD